MLLACSLSPLHFIAVQSHHTITAAAATIAAVAAFASVSAFSLFYI